MMKHIVLKGSLAGIIAGLVLGLFLKWMETLSGSKVYTLLLNIDYIPFLKFNEFGDFVLHLLVSIPLAIMLFLLALRFRWTRGIILRMVIFSFIVGILLYPLTLLSERTPAIDSVISISLWLIGHIIYGWTLGFIYCKLADHKKTVVTNNSP